MKLEEFTIGQPFFTGSGSWTVVDKGTIYIIAIKSKDYLSLNRFCPDTTLMMFEPCDFGGCSLTDRFT